MRKPAERLGTFRRNHSLQLESNILQLVVLLKKAWNSNEDGNPKVEKKPMYMISIEKKSSYTDLQQDLLI